MLSVAWTQQALRMCCLEISPLRRKLLCCLGCSLLRLFFLPFLGKHFLFHLDWEDNGYYPAHLGSRPHYSLNIF